MVVLGQGEQRAMAAARAGGRHRFFVRRPALMLVDITRETLSLIRNPAFRAYAERYVRISEQFMDQVRAVGIGVDETPQPVDVLERVRAKGATLRNDGKSLYVNRISPACLACQTGVGSVTFFLSLQCHRRCFYCFNPNQEGYDHFRTILRDCEGELQQIKQSGAQVDHVALTGGEPLLHKAETVSFFETARQLFPNVHTRLYTSGDLVDRDILAALQKAGLDEIRFSVRMQDSEPVRRRILYAIALAREYVPSVMVEMPVVPGIYEAMCRLLVELDALGVFGINLLELGFPMVNVEEFNRRGLRVKSRPYRVLYNYWYAGGLPVAGSETEALRLVEFALDQGLALGVHYCSLENKHTGQLFQQNASGSRSRILYFSRRDYFLKSAKVFGDDIPRALEAFRKAGCRQYAENRQLGFLEFHVSHVAALKGLGMEVGISYNVLETRDDGEYLRELKVDLSYPEIFEPATDL